jgi:uncharacterized protein (DUF983 family)
MEKDRGIKITNVDKQKQFAIPDVVEGSEQLVCPQCGSQNIYEFTYTDGIGCNSCGHQWAN